MSSEDKPSLPTDGKDQTYVSVKAIVAGKATLPLNIVLEDSHDEPGTNAIEVPAFSFLITHPERGQILFDLGIRKNVEGYPPVIRLRAHETFKGRCEEDVAEQLRKGGIEPEDINMVILSHLHWDHIGDPSLFPNAEIVLGEDTQRILADRVYPANPEGTITELPKTNKRIFVAFNDPSSTSFKTISPLGTFKNAVDFFGDGSMYLVDTPGHCPGHMSCLARFAADTFLFLAGDLCHVREAYEPGTRLISPRMYEDVETAQDTVRRLVTLNREMENVVVILAHEAVRLQEGIALFPEDIREWAMGVVEKRKKHVDGTARVDITRQ